MREGHRPLEAEETRPLMSAVDPGKSAVLPVSPVPEGGRGYGSGWKLSSADAYLCVDRSHSRCRKLRHRQHPVKEGGSHCRMAGSAPDASLLWDEGPPERPKYLRGEGLVSG